MLAKSCGSLPGFWVIQGASQCARFMATHRGVQRGEAPLRYSYPPRLGVWGLTSTVTASLLANEAVKR